MTKTLRRLNAVFPNTVAHRENESMATKGEEYFKIMTNAIPYVKYHALASCTRDDGDIVHNKHCMHEHRKSVALGCLSEELKVAFKTWV